MTVKVLKRSMMTAHYASYEPLHFALSNHKKNTLGLPIPTFILTETSGFQEFSENIVEWKMFEADIWIHRYAYG